MAKDNIINTLLIIEAQAESLRDSCRKARMLMAGEVSTSPKKSEGLSNEQRAKVIMKRKASVIRAKEKLELENQNVRP